MFLIHFALALIVKAKTWLNDRNEKLGAGNHEDDYPDAQTEIGRSGCARGLGSTNCSRGVSVGRAGEREFQRRG
jgi:hypothetical protein